MSSVGFAVLTMATIKSTRFWDVKPPVFQRTINDKVILGHN
jgi:hypothetical protein